MSNTLIVGGSRGIGLELCREYINRGDRVIATCRNQAGNLSNLEIRTISGVDVSRAEDVDKLKRELQGTRIDTLIHSAGILSRESLDDLDFNRIEQQFRVNTLGPLRVIHALLNYLGEGSKIGIISSRMGSMDDNGSGGMYGYRISKAAVNMAGVSLARDLEDRGIAVAILHPGMVATDMTGGKGVAVEDSARGLVERMDQLEMNNTGKFLHAEGYELPW
jgi:NAD(P)-dependent dehydrogenase (short-subunit alcohol dehydrogenase family)